MTRLVRIAAGDYETADRRYRVVRLVSPPAWETIRDPFTDHETTIETYATLAEARAAIDHETEEV